MAGGSGIVGRLAVVAVILVAVGACATTGRREETEQQRAQVVVLTRSAAELREDLGGLRTDLAALRARVDEVSRELKVALGDSEGRQRDAVEALRRQLVTTENRMAEVSATVTGVEASVGGLADQVARLEAVSVPAPGARPVPRGAASAGSRTPAPPPVSAEDLFDRAMESFRGGELGQAVLDFEEFVQKYPSHPLVASAQFWIGEAYFRARDFENAATELQKAVDLAPTGDKTPDGLLKIGLALRALKREERARESWARLVRDFPDSEAAQRARAFLREPPRPGRSGPASDPN